METVSVNSGNALGQHRFFFAAVVSGILAALASVLAKLASNTSPVTGGIVYETICHALLPSYSSDSTLNPCKSNLPGDSLEFYYQVTTLVRLAFVGCVVLANAAMWKSFTRALSQANASVHVTMLNNAANMIVTGICGLLIFREPVTLRWWAGAALIVLGSILMSQDSDKKDEIQKNK
ncbi:hypothetical protein BATDEDRAFT_37439 [Batrachochytrium dendrobatidis JAM81]|uniref:EamA domain-containing protein n=2 Tax=Batrachochytrium dendrobatidis TaxID=109871 RepID=F4PBL7_BATDJ|nr:uncharacterized protein BATDEDRAFT_37439 [Batrachochytrium dendrobatidis JAM81]EGF77346.1 hypothetical protein BATDEDRAFT_37439 [Batrachochytrium dendrobatidis JAM81]KAJ8327596.1 hypothetical protein O5D80_003954 [Batrachochytrium dendrobatidis]KAK5669235.1 hypothetical protein QVD99_003646 [Batrachochytrium dendrobatidis]OAJ37771.1 hypothetical protein BDEG_21763 [Batrachochytrium dendrobatidis JEL423]|eukprot:XP_006682018.1 hypothetical protein BATDEDRAFT_37439 [Batrachochytrium dendrobatidis JAM81]